MKKNIIVVTGGAGFVGSNLIEKILKLKKYKVISLDNYSSGNKRNHIKDKKVLYLRGSSKDIGNYLTKYKKKFHAFFILASSQEYTKVF